MVIIKINRNLLKAAAIVLLTGALCYNTFYCFQKTELSRRYESLVRIFSKSDRSALASFVASAATPAQRYKNVEVFDITKGEVIQKVQSSPSIQKEVEDYLNGITGLYSKVKAFPDKGYIVRVPLEPPSAVQNQWLSAYGINSPKEVFILFPEQGKPYLLILDESERPLFYTFEGDTGGLLEKLNFNRQNTQADSPVMEGN